MVHKSRPSKCSNARIFRYGLWLGNGSRPPEALYSGENNPPQAQILVSTNNTRPVSQPTTSTFHSLVILHPH